MTTKYINDITISIPINNLDYIWKGNFKDLPPNKNYQLIIDYPLSVNAKFKINTGTKGLGLIKLLKIIGKKYIHIYENEKQYGIWGHGIEDLHLEGVTVNHKKENDKTIYRIIKMQKLILCVGIPACGKSFWAKEEVRKDPEGTTRVNRDDLRNMMSNYTFTDSNEKLVTGVRDFAITHALKRGRNVIVDETNLNPRAYPEFCNMVKKLNIDCMVMEKPFYIDLEEAIERDSKRAGSGKVGEEIVKKFWKKSGGKQHKHYKPKVEVFYKNQCSGENLASAMEQDESLPKAIIVDLDGTLALMGKRSPYDASNCDVVDIPNKPVVETVKLFHNNGYKIIFCSGREDKDEAPSRRFIESCLPNIPYLLFMRKTADSRKDSIVKDEIFNENIKDKFYVLLILDDRTQVVSQWRSMGLTCYQVAPGDF